MSALRTSYLYAFIRYKCVCDEDSPLQAQSLAASFGRSDFNFLRIIGAQNCPKTNNPIWRIKRATAVINARNVGSMCTVKYLRILEMNDYALLNYLTFTGPIFFQVIYYINSVVVLETMVLVSRLLEEINWSLGLGLGLAILVLVIYQFFFIYQLDLELGSFNY